MNREPFAGPKSSPGYWLWHASLQWSAAIHAALAPLELTPVQFFLIGGLGSLPGGDGTGCSQIALATHTGLNPTMTSKVLRSLRGRGLVALLPDPADARAHLVRLTDAGNRLLTRAKPLIRAVDRDFFAAAELAPADVRQLLYTLATQEGTPR